MRALNQTLVLLFICFNLIALKNPLVAQNVLFDHHSNGITLDIQAPIFGRSSFIDFPTSGISLGGRFDVTDRVSLVAELPFVLARSRADISVESGLANIYAGAELSNSDKSLVLEFGTRLPTLTNSATGLAEFIGDLIYYDRREVFVDDFLGFSTHANYYVNRKGRLKLRLRGGPNLLIATGSSNNVTELLLDYAGQLIYKARRTLIKAGISGQFLPSQDDPLHSFGLGINFSGNRFKPGLTLRAPIGQEIRNFLYAVMGFNLTYNFK